MEYLRKNKKSLLMLAIALAVILVSSFFASMVQSAGYKSSVTDLRNETNNGVLYDANGNVVMTKDRIGKDIPVTVSGKVASGILFVPNTATEENPAPAVVLTHGYLNNRELQLQNAIELARRGFVVLTIDRGGHGNNEIDSDKNAMMNTDGLYDSAKYLYNLSYVDKARIGISGHSMGGYTTAMTLYTDAIEPALYPKAALGDLTPDPAGLLKAQVAGTNLGIISAGLMQGWSTFVYADRDVSVGMLKAMDDEFFFTSTLPDGTASICREYLHSTGAASFVGIPKTEWGTSKDSINIKSGDKYVGGSVIDVTQGEKASAPFRVIYEANEIHPLNHFSVESAGYVVDFFYAAFGTPANNGVIGSGNQIWWVKEMFSLIGLAAFFFLIFPVVSLLLTLPCFASLRKTEELDLDVGLGSIKKGGLHGITKTVTYFAGGVATMLFGGFIFRKAYTTYAGKGMISPSDYFPQDTTGSVANWALVCAGFALFVMLVVWAINFGVGKLAKKLGKEEVAVGNPFRCAKIDLISFVKTALLTLLVVGLLYAVVFINWGIWTVDFRIWTLDVKVFNLDMIPTMFRYSWVFFIFYAISAMGNAGFRLKDLPEWATIAINAFFNAFGILLVILIQYITFRSTGVLWQKDMALGYIVVFPMVAVLAIATIISRVLYKKTGNIWLGAMINALLFTIITVANTATSIPYSF